MGFIRAMREVDFDGPWGVEILSAEHRTALVEALTVARDSLSKLSNRQIGRRL